LLGGVKQDAIPAVLEVDADRTGLDHGRDGGLDVPVTGLDVGGYRQVNRGGDARDGGRGPLGTKVRRIRHAQRPGDAGACRGLSLMGKTFTSMACLRSPS
jgi:hypothetical protein